MLRVDAVWKWIWIYIIFVSVFVLAFTYSRELTRSDIQATGKVLFRALRDSECRVNCTNKKRRPVCGTDGVTYPSRCELKRAKRCEGRDVKYRKKGKCTATSVPMSKCVREREKAQAEARRPTLGVLIPECNRDGTFADVQCHVATGYCWCATKEGKPIAGTSVSGRRPSCRGIRIPGGIIGKHRRRKGREKGSKKKKGRCSQVDRRRFNENIVGNFTDEYNRAMRALGKQTAVLTNRPLDPTSSLEKEKEVVEWKFSQLDKDRDDALKRKEVRSLKRMVKKLIRPRSCAKRFVGYCDIDNNGLIERKEWSLCLGVDISTEQATPNPLEPQPREAEERGLGGRFELPRGPSLRPSMNGGGLIPARPNPPPPSSDREDHKKNCVEEREAALIDDMENPNGGIFIPKCTEDGKYAKAQCHKSTEYCWCVEESTGRPVPGTSTHRVQPKCDLEDERIMKGCPYPKKRRFLTDLMTQLLREMNEYAYNGTDPNKRPERNPDWSTNEQAVRWKMRFLDGSGNGVLERKELKEFKKIIKNRKQKYTRKCSRNFVRYCDENNDNRVTLQEWIDCTGIHHTYLMSVPERRGKNPFSEYLREN